MTALPTRLLLLLALSLLVLPVAQAQKSDAIAEGPQVEKMGNFEIQDLMVQIDYSEARRGRAQATVTVRPSEGTMELDKSSTRLVLVATSNGRSARIPLRAADDGTLTGTGTLPTLGSTDELALMTSRDTGLRFGIPVYDQRQGWNIEQGSAWNVEEGKNLVGMREVNGLTIDITIDTDPPVIVIVVKG